MNDESWVMFDSLKYFIFISIKATFKDDIKYLLPLKLHCYYSIKLWMIDLWMYGDFTFWISLVITWLLNVQKCIEYMYM